MSSQSPQLLMLRVLLVDDEPHVLSVLTAMLSRAGALVKPANSAATAYAALLEFEADLLITDIIMLDEDGYSLLRRIRAVGSSLPALAITGSVHADVPQKAKAAGFAMCLIKPFALNELIRVVSLLTARR